jgi:hypothetical protein
MKSLTKDALKKLKRAQNPPPTPTDLQAQKLSRDPKERARQLDYQAQATEMLGSGGDNNA